MKKQIYISLMTLGLFAALVVLPAYAQFQNSITVSIPFAFVAGEKQMPAGEYTIKSLINGSLHAKTLIRSKDGRNVVIVGTILVEAKSVQEEAKVTFNRYGDQHFLSQVWTPETNFGRELPKSDVEAKVASSGAHKDKVSVAASKR
jgi:hypothetical protein